MRKNVSWCLVFVLAIFLAVPPTARAARVILKPLDFKVISLISTSDVHWRTPVSIGGEAGSSPMAFTAPLKLPAGATITGLSYWHTTGSGGGFTNVMVGYADDNTTWQNEVLIFMGNSGAVTPDFNPIEVTGASQAGEKKVMKGRKYLVTIQVIPESFVWKVEVTYQK